MLIDYIHLGEQQVFIVTVIIHVLVDYVDIAGTVAKASLR
jgi:hypothetical protein